MKRGAKLAVDSDRRKDFEDLGHEVSYDAREAIERATVVIDCTPAGNENKERYYEDISGPKGYLAQGRALFLLDGLDEVPDHLRPHLVDVEERHRRARQRLADDPVALLVLLRRPR